MIDRMCRDCPQTAKGIFGIYPALSTNELSNYIRLTVKRIYFRGVWNQSIYLNFYANKQKNEVANLIALWPILFV